MFLHEKYISTAVKTAEMLNCERGHVLSLVSRITYIIIHLMPVGLSLKVSYNCRVTTYSFNN